MWADPAEQVGKGQVTELPSFSASKIFIDAMFGVKTRTVGRYPVGTYPILNGAITSSSTKCMLMPGTYLEGSLYWMQDVGDGTDMVNSVH